MLSNLCKGLFVVALTGIAPSAFANVITDWDEAAVAIVEQMPPQTAQRWMATVHAAMFDAVNSIEHRYQPYLTQLPASPGTSKEAAAASAAAAILMTIDATTAAKVKTLIAGYLTSVDDDKAKSDGIKLGEAVAAKVLEARANDGSEAPDAYRPRTTAGVYVPTAITAGSSWPTMKPFVLAKPSQFRPQPPVALTSKEWATDLNEVAEYGGKTSAKRSPQQTAAAQFWLTRGPQAYHPIARQIAVAKRMNIVDSARFMTLVAFGLTDALVAVFDAKYHYNFWRPITAIRNADIDDNAATDRVATWQPIDATPLHPEYPCAHCIQSSTLANVVKTVLGTVDIPEVRMTSPTAAGVVHSWTTVTAIAEEAANARIWAGFHYRFSTKVGTEMGRQIGEYIARSVMQPVAQN
jgi:hypothetical protein